MRTARGKSTRYVPPSATIVVGDDVVRYAPTAFEDRIHVHVRRPFYQVSVQAIRNRPFTAEERAAAEAAGATWYPGNVGEWYDTPFYEEASR